MPVKHTSMLPHRAEMAGGKERREGGSEEEGSLRSHTHVLTHAARARVHTRMQARRHASEHDTR